MTKKEKRIVIISLAVFLAAISSYIRVSSASYKRLAGKLKGELALAGQKQELWKLESTLPMINKAFSGRRDASGFISKIEDMARQSKITLTSIEPQTAQRQPLYERVPLKLSAVCNYNALGNFIGRLEGSKEFIRIDKLNLAPIAQEANKKGEGPTEAKLEMFISAIYLN